MVCLVWYWLLFLALCLSLWSVPEKYCGYGESFHSSRAFQQIILVLKEQLLMVPGILIRWDSQKHLFLRPLCWYYYSTILCLVFIIILVKWFTIFSFLFKVHLKILNTELALWYVYYMWLIRERNIITIWHILTTHSAHGFIQNAQKKKFFHSVRASWSLPRPPHHSNGNVTGAVKPLRKDLLLITKS